MKRQIAVALTFLSFLYPSATIAADYSISNVSPVGKVAIHKHKKPKFHKSDDDYLCHEAPLAPYCRCDNPQYCETWCQNPDNFYCDPNGYCECR
ncbi:hypothetical protein ACVWYK_001274 [Bradyrhizobium sp. USDA 4470]